MKRSRLSEEQIIAVLKEHAYSDANQPAIPIHSSR